MADIDRDNKVKPVPGKRLDRNGPVNKPEIDDASKNIVDHGFRPLQPNPSSTRKYSTTRSESFYKINYTTRESEFGLLYEFKLHLQKSRSKFWIYPQVLFEKLSEVGIQFSVIVALTDVLDVAQLDKLIRVEHETSLSLGFRLDEPRLLKRADLVSFLNETKSIVGICEMKLPPNVATPNSQDSSSSGDSSPPFCNGSMSPLSNVPESSSKVKFDMSQMCQTADYMVFLRNYYRVRFVFAILTTYEEWKILWFEDTDEAAQATSKQEYDNLCLKGDRSNDVFITSNATIYHTKVYHHSDPQLVQVLASFLYKVSKTPIHTPKQFIDKTIASPYIYANQTDMVYQALPDKLQTFKYDLPSPNVEDVFMLSYLHRGGDGRVALCASKDGCLAVIKFLNDPQNQIDNLEAEAHPGLVMPFCLIFSSNLKNDQGVRQGWFASLGAWKKSWPDPLSSTFSPIDEIQGDINTGMLEHYQANPSIAVDEALDVLSENMINHEDLELRHLALLPILNPDTQVYDFKHIFIDLTCVSPCQPEQAQHYFQDCKVKLNHQLDEILSSNLE